MIGSHKAFLALSLSATSSRGADGREFESAVPAVSLGGGSPGAEQEPL